MRTKDLRLPFKHKEVQTGHIKVIEIEQIMETDSSLETILEGNTLL